MPSTEHILKINHLYLRAGFGLKLADMEKVYQQNLFESIKGLFNSSLKIKPIKLVEYSGAEARRMKNLNPEARKSFRKKQREQLKQLNLHWLLRLAHSPQQLREKVTLFWHGHFACRAKHPAAMQHLNNVHREHGLGDFRTLLMEVSKSPAMLSFLNNKQNRKASPNENFARELLELFTLGRGNYSENDIKEAARAFTGWNFDNDGKFLIRHRQHDQGSKTFMGKSGNFGGEEIIEIVLAKPQCARFLAKKIHAYFVNPQPNEMQISKIADWLFDSDYQIGETLSKIFSADWFYAQENIGAKIKSPVELLAGIFRQLEIETKLESPAIFRLQNGLGQVLFKPPNVAGWPGNRAWIDSSTLLIRLKLSGMLMGLQFPELKMKGGLKDSFDKWQTKMSRKLDLEYSWKRPLRAIPAESAQAQWAWLAPRLLQQGAASSKFVLEYLGSAQADEQKKRLIWRLMALPSYQIC